MALTPEELPDVKYGQNRRGGKRLPCTTTPAAARREQD
jgi:hypothetical protein